MGFKKFRKTTRPRGISLVELLMGAGLASFLIIVFISLYLGHFKIFSNQNMSMDVASQIKLGLDEIANEIRESQTVVTTCANCGSDQTSATILILRLWPLDTSSEPFEPTTSDYDYIIYKLDPIDNTEFMKRVLPDPTSSRKADNRIIATNIAGLQFTYNNADPVQATEVTVSITGTKTAFGRTYTQTHEKQVLLRNK